jgi:hypothetical protein
MTRWGELHRGKRNGLVLPLEEAILELSMNNTSLLCLLGSAFVLAGCADTGSDSKVSLSPERVASVMASHDNLIVPGERIGRVFLGMSTAELYRAMGDPINSTAFNSGTFGYEWHDLNVMVSQSKTVTWITTSGSTYSLVGGLTVGSSILALQSTRPAPAFSKAFDASRNSYCYSDGLGVDTRANNVVAIQVWSPGCNGSGHYSCYHWENGIQMIDTKCRRD